MGMNIDESSTCGKNKSRSNLKQDLISKLDPSIISHILSCLSLKEAVRTCVLSRYWERKWTSIYNIDINDGSYSNKKIPDFYYFMVIILTFITRKSDIKSFRLTCYREYDSNSLTIWVSGVLIHTHASLTELSILLNGTLENPSLWRSFSQLRKLCFGGVGGENNSSGVLQILNPQCSLGKLILDFSVLEVLEFRCCKCLNVTSVEIRAPRLISFKSDSVIWVNDVVINMYADKLEVFELSGSVQFSMEKYILSKPSVHYASLTYTVNNSELENLGLHINMMLKEFLGLKHLKVSAQILKALLQEKIEVSPMFDRLKHVEIETSCGNEELLKFLEMVPSLEYLSLNVNFLHCDQVESCLPACLMSNLKEVKLTNFIGKKDQIDLAKVILKNAKKLEKLLVFGADTKMMDDIKLQLSNLPKLSAHVSIGVQ